MECQRLNKMIRSWYVQVQSETLAPARMVEFMEQHISTCDDCFMDPGIQEELKKIIAIVLPPSKMTKPPKSAKKVMPEMPSAQELAVIENEKADDTETDDDAETDGNDADDDLEDDDIEVDEVSLDEAELE